MYALLTPRPTICTGKLARDHCLSATATLKTTDSPHLRVSSKAINKWLSKHGKVEKFRHCYQVLQKPQSAMCSQEQGDWSIVPERWVVARILISAFKTDLHRLYRSKDNVTESTDIDRTLLITLIEWKHLARRQQRCWYNHEQPSAHTCSFAKKYINCSI